MIKYKDGYKYQLAETYEVETGLHHTENIQTDLICLTVTGKLTIRKHYAWDGASGPTIDTKSSMRGSLVHDALYQLIRMGLLPTHYKDEVDLLFEKICKEDGMWTVRASLWERAVSLFGRSSATAGKTKPVLTAP